MGSLFKTKPALPVQPYNTYRDEVNGVEQVAVRNADGTISYVTRALPKSAEEQVRLDALDGIRNEALAEISKLSAANYQTDEATLASLNDWVNAQQQTLQKTLASRSNREEAELARRGMSDSTAAQTIRRERFLDEQEAGQAIAQGRSTLADDIRNQRLSLQQSLYALAQQGVSSSEAKQYQAAINSQSRAAAADAQRQASLLDYYTRLNTRESPISVVARGSMGSVSANPGSLLGSWKIAF